MGNQKPGQESSDDNQQVTDQESGTQGAGTSATTDESGKSAAQTLNIGEIVLPDMNDDEAWAKLPKTIRDLRTENAKHRTDKKTVEDERDSLKQQLEELRQAGLTAEQKEVERLKKLEAEELPKQIRRNQELEIQLAATKLDIVDPEAAVQLLDWKRVEKGEKVEDVLKDLVAKKPWLKKLDTQSSSSDDDGEEGGEEGDEESKGGGTSPKKASPANPAGSGNGKQTFTREQLGKMGTDAINKLWEDGTLQTAIQEGRVKAK